MTRHSHINWFIGDVWHEFGYAGRVRTVLGMSEVSANIGGVIEASQQTSLASGQVLTAAAELAKNGAMLRREVESFLHAVRTL